MATSTIEVFYIFEPLTCHVVAIPTEILSACLYFVLLSPIKHCCAYTFWTYFAILCNNSAYSLFLVCYKCGPPLHFPLFIFIIIIIIYTNLFLRRLPHFFIVVLIYANLVFAQISPSFFIYYTIHQLIFTQTSPFFQTLHSTISPMPLASIPPLPPHLYKA